MAERLKGEAQVKLTEGGHYGMFEIVMQHCAVCAQ